MSWDAFSSPARDAVRGKSETCRGPLGFLSGRLVILLLRRGLQNWQSKVRVLYFTRLTELG